VSGRRGATPKIHRLPLLLAVAAAAALCGPAAAQTLPVPPPQANAPQAPAAPQANAPVPLPTWFHEIDTAKKREVSRADFVKFRMRTFDDLDANKDGKLTLEEYLKIAEPPFNADGPGKPGVEERRVLARSEFKTLDTNGNGIIERVEAEMPFHAEFNQYDTDRDNKITEPELRLIVQNSLRREEQARREAEARNRAGKMAINEYIDLQLREADRLDKNSDGRISAPEYQSLAGAADGQQSQNPLPFEVRRKLVMLKFTEIDTNKDSVLDRVELTAYAVGQFLKMDLNKDRFLTEDEFRKAQEAEIERMKTVLPTLMPVQQKAPAQPPKPAPVPAQPPKPGLPQGTPR
jgi:Ca2+-binding EF-hand superfamily protein